MSELIQLHVDGKMVLQGEVSEPADLEAMVAEVKAMEQFRDRSTLSIETLDKNSPRFVVETVTGPDAGFDDDHYQQGVQKLIADAEGKVEQDARKCLYLIQPQPGSCLDPMYMIANHWSEAMRKYANHLAVEGEIDEPESVTRVAGPEQLIL